MQVAEPEGFSEKQEKKGSQKRRRAGQPHFATESGTLEEPASEGGGSPSLLACTLQWRAARAPQYVGMTSPCPVLV
jgi:hypothetical protein